MEAKAYWVAFNYVKGIGAVRLQTLLDAFNGNLGEAWQAPADRLKTCGLNAKIIENILRVRNQLDLDRIWQRLQADGINVLTWEDEGYPALLREIDQPPPVLYVKGELLPEDDLAVAIVGTRRVSVYGRQTTEDLAGELARAQVTIVSGLARGTDATAHRSALRAGGRTIAVLGSGIDRIYPPENRALAEDIAESGAIITDYPPGTAPESTNFPPRNRIISGLSRCVIVIEAGETSGALITATFAANQGRDVLALPGNINSPNSKGTNRLIQQGARPLLSAQDVFETLNFEQVNTQRIARKILPADDTEAKIIQILGESTMQLDELSFLSGFPVDRVSATLALMELKGMVRNAGGMSFSVIHEDSTTYWTD